MPDKMKYMRYKVSIHSYFLLVLNFSFKRLIIIADPVKGKWAT